jgi:hypothetical protein
MVGVLFTFDSCVDLIQSNSAPFFVEFPHHSHLQLQINLWVYAIKITNKYERRTPRTLIRGRALLCY